MTLGIPGNAVTALLLGAFMIHGTQPGPLMMQRTPDLFWGIIASMYVGNIILLILNLPLISMWVRILKIPYPILSPLILLFCIVGAYSLNSNLWDIAMMIFFGVLGHVMRKAGFEGAPMILSLVIGQMFENAFRQSLLLGDGNFLDFRQTPYLGSVDRHFRFSDLYGRVSQEDFSNSITKKKGDSCNEKDNVNRRDGWSS